NPLASPCSGTPSANAISLLHAAGVVVFASSGNEGHDDGISEPACIPEAISVGGVYDASVGGISWCGNSSCSTTLCTDTTGPDVFVCHSNSDEILDLLAPNWRTTSPAMGGGVAHFGGTSASSPYAAGQAALLLADRPGLQPEDIRSLLAENGPLVTNPDNGLSFPRSDVGSAIGLPEPSGTLLLASGAALLAALGRRRGASRVCRKRE
ncbi:MAG: S8 family serine peptidase, partial [Deltaproteobacteria bacterium]|nr:S8 family serine peptidase [Deltaproteobacteria bacterium]